jgi:hypothetical protein
LGFFVGFALPVEHLPIVFVGPAITVAGLVLGYLELRSPSSDSVGWCATDLVAGLAITIYGFMERRRESRGVALTMLRRLATQSTMRNAATRAGHRPPMSGHNQSVVTDGFWDG